MMPVIAREVDHEGLGFCIVIPEIHSPSPNPDVIDELYNQTTDGCEVWAIHGQEYDSRTGMHFISFNFRPVLETRALDIYAFKPVKPLNRANEIIWYANDGSTVMDFLFCQPLTPWEFSEVLKEQQKYLIAYNIGR